jgi:hypothetical protein
MLKTAAFVLLATTTACDPEPPVTVDPLEASDGKADSLTKKIPNVRCSGTPNAGATGDWRHFKSRLISLASPKHRGIDLAASANDATQTVAGDLSYGITDKALEDEQVDLFACRAGQWRAIGSAISDGEGGFQLGLGGGARLPIGLRDMYLSVSGDRTGTRFMALVAPAGTRLVVSDVDGTLTSSENAYPESLLTGDAVDAKPYAARFLRAVAARGYVPVYLSTRGRAFTGDTRDWLGGQGFPRGILRLAPGLLTLPGSPAESYKEGALDGLGASGLHVAIGLGNRDSDAEAYQHAGVSGDTTFLNTSEFADEVQPFIDNGSAVGFEDYSELMPIVPSL